MIDIVEPRFWELYVNWAAQHKVRPTMKGYMQWFEEQYNEDFDEDEPDRYTD